MSSFHLIPVTIAALCAFGSACADAGVLNGEDSGSFHLSRLEAPAGLTRDEVRAQVSAARAAGELGAMSAEDSGSHLLAQQAAAGTRSRDEVRAEMLAARASGELQALTGEDSGCFYPVRTHAQGRPTWIAAR